VRRSALLWAAVGVVGFAVLAFVPVQAAPASRERNVCSDPTLRSQAEAVFDRHRANLRAARHRVEDELYALRRLLTSTQATRTQVDESLARLSEARAALERARVAFLWELRESLPADQRGVLMRCFLGRRGWRWR
jgi:Spy/CpxP family protein refolding chaperone